MSDFKPYPKSEQLKRGERRRFRFKANRTQWQILHAQKDGPCRVCADPASNGAIHSRIELHHLVARSQGGDDYAANLIPLCPSCHALVTNRDAKTIVVMLANLTDEERGYLVWKRR